MSKGTKQILKFNKQFDKNCNNSLGICKLVYRINREYIALKGYWIFLVLFSGFGLFLTYKPYQNGRDYFGTMVMFLVPIIADVFNTKIYDSKIKKLKIIQLIILGIFTFICLLGLFSNSVEFLSGNIVLHKPFPMISISIDFIWNILLITIISLIANISGAKSELESYYESINNNNNNNNSAVNLA